MSSTETFFNTVLSNTLNLFSVYSAIGKWHLVGFYFAAGVKLDWLFKSCLLKGTDQSGWFGNPIMEKWGTELQGHHNQREMQHRSNWEASRVWWLIITGPTKLSYKGINIYCTSKTREDIRDRLVCTNRNCIKASVTLAANCSEAALW